MHVITGHTLDLATSRENLYSGFQIRSDTKRSVQPQKIPRGLKFQIYEEEGLYYLCSENTKALISCVVSTQLTCFFVFAYAKSRLFNDVARLLSPDTLFS